MSNPHLVILSSLHLVTFFDNEDDLPVLPLPTLDEFGYQPLRFLETDSKMSTILLAGDGQDRLYVLKIARVDQAVRADLNRQAILNTIEWFTTLGSHPGIADLFPLRNQSQSAPSYLARLRGWEGAPEFLVMEYLAGGSLRDLVGQQRLPLELALQIALGIAQALAFIHKAGCVHRDLKPENILFRTTPQRDRSLANHETPPLPILIDFGVAARAGESRFVSGSRLWMAPELQTAYERYPLPVDPAWDLYALGLLVCYMISGVTPRRRSYDWASYESYRQRALTLLDREFKSRIAAESKVRPQLKELLNRTLAQDAAARPSADQFAGELIEILRQLGVPIAQNGTSAAFWPIKPTRTLGAMMALLIILVALLGLLFNLPFNPQQLWSQTDQLHPPVMLDLQPTPQPDVKTFSTTVTATAETSVGPAPTLAFTTTLLPTPPTLVQYPKQDSPPTLVPYPGTALDSPPTLLPRTQ
ncbi:MAG: serine/threonine-protein kinase [Caldilineaceae bacterium]